jgi:ribonuclease Z
MIIVPLGTSSGMPTIERGVSGLALSLGGSKKWLLIDCGEGTQQQIMRSGYGVYDRAPKLAWQDLEAILITHAHGDHCFGLFGIMAMLSMVGRKAPLKIVAPGAVQAMAQAVLAHSKTFLTYPVEWTEPSSGLCLDLRKDLTCECVELSHRAPSHGYILRSSKIRATANASKLLSLGFVDGPALGEVINTLKNGIDVMAPCGVLAESAHLITFESVEESIYVGGDNSKPNLVAQAAQGVDVWVHEATYSQADWEQGGAGEKWGHSSARQVGEAAEQAKPSVLILTHFSPRYGSSDQHGVGALVQEAREVFGGEVIAAKELVSITREPRRTPTQHSEPSLKLRS